MPSATITKGKKYKQFQNQIYERRSINPQGWWTFTPTPEYLVFVLCETLKNDLNAIVLEVSNIGHDSTHSGRFGFPYVKWLVIGTLTDLKTWELGEEIITNKEDQEHLVINGVFKIKHK